MPAKHKDRGIKLSRDGFHHSHPENIKGWKWNCGVFIPSIFSPLPASPLHAIISSPLLPEAAAAATQPCQAPRPFPWRHLHMSLASVGLQQTGALLKPEFSLWLNNTWDTSQILLSILVMGDLVLFSSNKKPEEIIVSLKGATDWTKCAHSLLSFSLKELAPGEV